MSETTTDRLAEIEEQAQPQPVQVREGRWRTRSGDIRNITPTPNARLNADRFSWHDAHYNQTWLPSGRYHLGGDSLFDLVEYLGPIEPEPEQTITPDDVAPEALAGVFDQGKAEQEIAELQAQVRFLKNRELTLGTRLEEEKAVTAKRLQQVEELRSQVHYRQQLLTDERRRVEELAQKLAEAQPQPVHLQAMMEAQAETIARMHSEINALNTENVELETQLEAVKADLAQVSRDRYTLQIELDAREQVPEAVSDRFDQGFEQGTSRAVETIAEWTEPFRTCGSQALAYHVMQNLPHIMRTLTGLADED